MRIFHQSKSKLIIKSMLVNLALILIGNVTCVKLSAQTAPTRDSRYYILQAQQAYKEKNYSSYLEHLRAAIALRPNHPTLMYNLAGAYALVGQHHESISLLGRVADMGLIYPADQESDFGSVRNSPEFQKILQTFKRNSTHVGDSRTAFTLNEKGLVPESLAYDPVGRVFYVGSMYRRKILSVDAGGVVKEFADEGDGLWSAFGMKVDAGRRLLWVCTGAHSRMSGFEKSEDGNSAILKFDLTTGKLLRKYLLPNTSGKHLLGDLAVNARGDVFTTDSLSPAVYVIDHRKDELELFAESELFVSLQGLDFSSDQRSLYVADYARGLFVIDLPTRKVSPLAAVTDTALLGIDGLYFYKSSLLAIQNGTNPARVVRLFLDAPGRRITKWETVEANNSIFDEPTLGVLVKNDFYYVANSQWGMVNPRGELASQEKLKDAVILKLRL